MKFIIDIDGVLRNIVDRILDIYKTDFDRDYIISYEDITQYRISPFLPLLKDDDALVDAFFKGKYAYDVFVKANPHDNAIESLRSLHDDGHFIHIATNQFKGVEHLTMLWLYNNSVPYDLITFGKHKYMLDADVFIDDSTDILTEFRQHNPHSLPVCVTQPWNSSWEGLRVNNLKELIDMAV